MAIASCMSPRCSVTCRHMAAGVPRILAMRLWCGAAAGMQDEMEGPWLSFVIRFFGAGGWIIWSNISMVEVLARQQSLTPRALWDGCRETAKAYCSCGFGLRYCFARAGHRLCCGYGAPCLVRTRERLCILPVVGGVGALYIYQGMMYIVFPWRLSSILSIQILVLRCGSQYIHLDAILFMYRENAFWMNCTD
jgi:hypothetical protein